MHIELHLKTRSGKIENKMKHHEGMVVKKDRVFVKVAKMITFLWYNKKYKVYISTSLDHANIIYDRITKCYKYIQA